MNPTPGAPNEGLVTFTGGEACPSCGQPAMRGYTHVCIPTNAAPILPGTVNLTQTIDYEKEALRAQVHGLIGYVAELRKHLHHHVGCLKAKNRWHLRSTIEECDMCRAELADCERLLALHYKSGTVE